MGNAARIPTLIVAAVAVSAILGGCTQLRAHRGQILEPILTQSIQPGVDNRESVETTLGRPTFVGQFTPNEWYYISRSTRQSAFGSPKTTEQTILRVTFDGQGNVVGVNTAGTELIANIDPNGDKTPTLGRTRTFFEEIFGNIGAVGVPGGGAQPTN